MSSAPRLKKLNTQDSIIAHRDELDSIMLKLHICDASYSISDEGHFVIELSTIVFEREIEPIITALHNNNYSFSAVEIRSDYEGIDTHVGTYQVVDGRIVELESEGDEVAPDEESGGGGGGEGGGYVCDPSSSNEISNNTVDPTDVELSGSDCCWKS